MSAPTLAAHLSALLTAAGLPVAGGTRSRARGVIVKPHGDGACEVRFRPERPSDLPAGIPWNADVTADVMVARACSALRDGYALSTSGTGRATVLLVAARKSEAA